MSIWNILRMDNRPRARTVWFDVNLFYVRLTDGRLITVPIDRYRRIREASAEQRDHWELIARGTGIHWPDIDEDLSVAGLLRDFGAVPAAPSRQISERRAAG